MPSFPWWLSLPVIAGLLSAAAVLARSARRRRMAAGGDERQARLGRPGPARDRTAVDRIEQELRALDWLWQQGRISRQEYQRQRELTLRD
jgi:hypothetical protein